MGRKKGLSFQEILRRIAGNHEFGKDRKTATLRSGLPRPASYLFAILSKITNNRVYLDKGNLHLTLPMQTLKKNLPAPLNL